MEFQGNIRMIPMDCQWNLNGIPMTSKFNQCKSRVQHQHILKSYLSGIHMGEVQLK